MLLFAAVLTLLFYIHGSASIIDASASSRYLTCIFISFPAVLWPLWKGSGVIQYRVPLFVDRAWLLARLSVLLLIGCLLLSGSISIFDQVPSAQAENRNDQAVIATLEHLGITRFYTEYWTCVRLAFASQEHVVCSNLQKDLIPDWDRYYPYRVMVRADPNPGFVFPLKSDYTNSLEKLMQTSHVQYQRVVVVDLVVYKPARSVPLPS